MADRSLVYGSPHVVELIDITCAPDLTYAALSLFTARAFFVNIFVRIC